MISTVSRLRGRIAIRRRVTSANWRLMRPRRGRPHHLPGELIVSLTSFPARFATLHLTIGCLLDQTVRADRIVLWIAHEDLPALPKAVTKLQRRGVEIRACEDLRSYKKLVPALHAFPDAYIVTADDDLEFSPNWLEILIESVSPKDHSIVCHRAHRSARWPDGRLTKYVEWDFDVQDTKARRPSIDIIATTGAGALFPPRVLPGFATEARLFRRLCPDGDDVWFWWCARLAGTPTRKVGGANPLFTWPGTQESSLWRVNREGGNDQMIEALSVELPEVFSLTGWGGCDAGSDEVAVSDVTTALTLINSPGRALRSRKASGSDRRQDARSAVRRKRKKFPESQN
jgi:Glycosyl transferase family 2